MESYSNMNDIQTNMYSNLPTSPPNNKCEEKNPDCYNLDAHLADSMKVKRPVVTQNDLPVTIPDKKPYTDYEANNKLKVLNEEIFKDTHNGQTSSSFILKPLNTDKFEYKNSENTEVKKHEFNFKRYLTIFGILGLLTAAIVYFRRGKG